MPNLLTWVQGLCSRPNSPSREATPGLPAGGPPVKTGPIYRLKGLSPEAIRNNYMVLENRLRDVDTALADHAVEMRSLIDAYASAESDQRRRFLALKLPYLVTRGDELIVFHHDLVLLLSFWDGVRLQQAREVWRDDIATPSMRMADGQSIHDALMASIAQTENWRADMQATVDTIAIATDKALSRREFGHQSAIATLDELSHCHRSARDVVAQSPRPKAADSKESIPEPFLRSTGRVSVPTTGNVP